ncbi:transglutaminase family protein [Pseudotabrizicola sediminis]|uniref:Transglutaminase family protein n=1 Tax=Pseudotabrizicola sediminis TaxID=2486418 RepID=A0ABY2KIJ8_9RHOB|nr:transglutaminase family protein [Pseudotabrizicola sediminis]TGD42169.1 transglutaminase family protein [Pseudotabrizicola sediminis]TGD64108.1 transglutaminase family protein [Tabrizicola sp. WMC-M-20]
MLIRYGYDFTLFCAVETPVVTMVSARPERSGDMERPEVHTRSPDVPEEVYTDSFGNICRRFTAPAGTIRLQGEGFMYDSGAHDPVTPDAVEHPVSDLPDEALMYLLSSRYCEVDKLSQVAWDQFGHLAPGWSKVQAICDYVHSQIRFNYADARNNRTAFDAWQEGRGVCRDFAHLAITLCRAMNIPARYVNGQLGDFGIPYTADPMDYAAWMEVYLGGAWHTFDPRNNKRRIGRIVIAYGRDAVDVPMITSFGPHELRNFKVITDEVTDSNMSQTAAQ